MRVITQNYANGDKVVFSFQIDENGKVIHAELSALAAPADILVCAITMQQKISSFESGHSISLPPDPSNLPMMHQ